MFESFPLAPPDPILGLNEAFQKDPRADKVNLGVGVYMDDAGTTPTLAAVRLAEQKIFDADFPKTYLPIPGSPRYGKLVQELVFAGTPGVVESGRVVTAQSPGGTGALRTAADLIHMHHRGATVWVSTPTWENHVKIFEAAGLATKGYRYWDAATRGLDRAGLLDDLARAAPGDVVLLHGSCHNPTGVDPDAATWGEIAALVRERRLLPFVDLAYQGLGDGVEEDLVGVGAIAGACDELIVASSFSKNLGLYGERTGALSIVSKDADVASKVMSQLKIAIRTNYSNPARHGGAIVEAVLGDPALRESWRAELEVMRTRIHAMRRALVDGLTARGVTRDVSYFANQKGMFSYTGLSPEQVDVLRERHGIFMVRSGRINVAGLGPKNLDVVLDAMAAVMKG